MPLNRHYDPEERSKKMPEWLARYKTLDHDRVAGHAVEEAVQAVICGLVNEGLDLARRCVPVIAGDSELSEKRQQEENREPRGYWLHSAEVFRLWYLGLAQWLTGAPATAAFREAAQNGEKMIAGAKETSSIAAKEDLDLYMQIAIQSGDDAHVLAFYNSESREAAQPLPIRQTKSIRRVCEAVCRHRQNGEFTGDEVRRALDNLLKKHTEEWLTTGWSHGAATFLKVRFADLDGIASPVEVLMHAYDYLPGRRRPAETQS
jgi:hypothetical protein